MLDHLALNKQSQSGVEQNHVWNDNEGPDTPNKTSYFGFRIKSAKHDKKDNESSMRSSH